MRALRDSEERYRRLFEHATEGIVLADARTGEIVDCNRAFSTLTGYERSELTGRQQSMLHTRGKARQKGSRRPLPCTARRTRGRFFRRKLQCKSGECKHVEIKANTIELNGRALLQGFLPRCDG